MECISIKTDYSLLKSMIKIPDLISYGINNDYKVLGIIDDNLSSTIEFITLCQKNNIKPVIGYHTSIDNLDIYLYAKNEDGLKDLFKLNTYLLDNDLDIITLTKYLTNIIVLIPYESKDLYDKLKNISDIFIGYQNDYEKNNALLICQNIIYFKVVLALTKEDTKYLSYLKVIDDNTSLEYQDIEYTDNYIYSDNYDDFISLIDINISSNDNLIPHFDENIKDSYKYLEALAIKGLNKRLNGIIPDNYKERLLYELSIIKKMNYVDYFLIVYDYVKYARLHNILVGPGRGSAAGSLVTYCLGITMIDPLKYNLLFERFLNPERVTMPDIDVDFDASKRQEMIDYVKDRYGSAKVMPIMTYGTFASKQALLSVAKILNVNISSLNKYINPKESLKNNLTKEVIRIINNNRNIKKVYYEAMKFEGMKKHISTHAAGIVICKKNLDEVIPINKSGDVYLTGYTMDYLEALGLLKMDFLAIKDLTIISHILNTIKDDLNINKIDLNIKEVLDNFTYGLTTGIFQFESEGMKSFLAKLKPTTFDDLVVALALYRPGPMENIDTFIKRKKGEEKIDYITKELESILKETYGIIVYQEQIIQIFTTIAGYSYGEADVIRRAISKKKEKVILEEADKFIKRAIENGYSKEISTKIYNYIMKFANYGFNKSHSVAYALVGYQMMYLKVKYPLEFYVSLLNENIGSVSKTKEYLDEVKMTNIEIIKPNINLSREEYYILDNKIVMPLGVIKNIGGVIAKEIVKELDNGPFKDFYDFLLRTYNLKIGNKTIELLIYSGALDIFNLTRKTMIENLSSILLYAELSSGLDSSLVSKPDLNLIDEYPPNEIMEKELDLYGFYVSAHPAGKYNTPKIKDIRSNFNKTITSYYLLEKCKMIITKTGSSMAFLSLSDETGVIDGTIFPNRINYANIIKVGDILKVTSHVERRFDKYQLIVNKIEVVNN